MDNYETDINSYLSGNTDFIDFGKKEELIELNTEITIYNNTIMKHRKFKDNFLLEDFCNTDIARLNTFEVIFNNEQQ